MSQNLLKKVSVGVEGFCGLFAADTTDAIVKPSAADAEDTCRAAAEPTVHVSRRVLDSFRKNVGRYAPETGGLLGSTGDAGCVDLCHFDRHSRNTPGTFYYDVPSMSAVFRDWKAKGYVTNGIYHSHPRGCTRPSYHDISTALLHIRFFQLDYFYLPIFQPGKQGLYTMLFYVIRKADESLTVTLDHVLKATKKGYKRQPFQAWQESYLIQDLDRYRQSVEAEQTQQSNPDGETESQPVSGAASAGTVESPAAAPEYFSKVRSLYPQKVLDKVIVCIGVGGARSFLENCARSGFRNYILMDGDTVSPTNIATQGVFVSEMGRKKVEVVRDRILDINPGARVVCVDRFLDDRMSDEEFKGFLDQFPDHKPTDYLILGCTDQFEAQKRSSMLALKYGTPYLAAMMYAEGAAAELIFTYPGVTESCPRCLLRDRFEKYEHGFRNDVDSSACPIFATERMNATKGYIALMLLMYHEDESSPYHTMLDEVADRNFVWIRLTPHLKDTPLRIGLFDRIFSGAPERYTFMDETLWIPQRPDRPENGSAPCKMCGGTGDLRELSVKWANLDTRKISFTE